MNNTNLETYTQDLTPIVIQAESLTIDTKEDLYRATDVLSKLNKFNDRITEEKAKITKPLNQALKVERARWKPLETKYEVAIDLVKHKMGVYYENSTKETNKVEDQIAEQLEKGQISQEEALEMLKGVEGTDKSVASDSGTATFVKVKKFEVMDLVMLVNSTGDKYVLPNEVAIRQAMKEGVELKGVRYYEEQSIRNIR